MTEIQKENCVTGLTDFVRFMYGNSIHDCWVNFDKENKTFDIILEIGNDEEHLYTETCLCIGILEDKQECEIVVDCFGKSWWNMSFENIVAMVNIVSEILFGYTYERVKK